MHALAYFLCNNSQWLTLVLLNPNISSFVKDGENPDQLASLNSYLLDFLNLYKEVMMS